MDDDDFEQLIARLGRVLAFTDEGESLGGLRLPSAIDAAAIRKKTGLSQAAFARRIGVPLATIRNREQCLWCHSQHAVSIPPVPLQDQPSSGELVLAKLLRKRGP